MEHREMKNSRAPSLLGYGGMRFPVDKQTGQIDFERAAALIHRAMEAGVTYYDTAWPYHNGQSEGFLGQVLGEYPRDSYFLATKLPCWQIESLEQAKQVFAAQLEHLKTDHIDFYLLHTLSARTWKKMVELGVVDWCRQLREEGRIKQFGFSFHDSYQAFEEILTSCDWDFCQIQLNYMDTEHQAGLKGYALAEQLGVPVVVMEPVKGGLLAQLPDEVSAPLRHLRPERSDAGWALSWVASLPNVKVVLSGMSDMEQLEDNLALFDRFVPLNREEEAAVGGVAAALRARVRSGCTGCKYCMPCPKGVDIPKVFRVWNTMGMYENKRLTGQAWKAMRPEQSPSSCVGCGLCMQKCPQHLSIPEDLARAGEELNRFSGLER